MGNFFSTESLVTVQDYLQGEKTVNWKFGEEIFSTDVNVLIRHWLTGWPVHLGEIPDHPGLNMGKDIASQILVTAYQGVYNTDTNPTAVYGINRIRLFSHTRTGHKVILLDDSHCIGNLEDCPGRETAVSSGDFVISLLNKLGSRKTNLILEFPYCFCPKDANIENIFNQCKVSSSHVSEVLFKLAPCVFPAIEMPCPFPNLTVSSLDVRRGDFFTQPTQLENLLRLSCSLTRASYVLQTAIKANNTVAIKQVLQNIWQWKMGLEEHSDIYKNIDWFKQVLSSFWKDSRFTTVFTNKRRQALQAKQYKQYEEFEKHLQVYYNYRIKTDFGAIAALIEMLNEYGTLNEIEMLNEVALTNLRNAMYKTIRIASLVMDVAVIYQLYWDFQYGNTNIVLAGSAHNDAYEDFLKTRGYRQQYSYSNITQTPTGILNEVPGSSFKKTCLILGEDFNSQFAYYLQQPLSPHETSKISIPKLKEARCRDVLPPLPPSKKARGTPRGTSIPLKKARGKGSSTKDPVDDSE